MLGIDGYDKILKFAFEMNNYLNSINEVPLFETLNENLNFRKYILNLLSQIFGFQHTAFFITNENEVYTNPVGMVNDNLMYFLRLYDQYYYKQNIFYFENIPDTLASKKLLTVSDVMSYNKDKYYKFLELHKNCGYYDVVTLPLNTTKQLLGAVVIYKPNNEYFTNKDIDTLFMLNKYLTQGLKTYLKISQYIYQQNALKNYTNNLATGVIVLDNNLSVIYFNNKATEFCDDLLSNQKINKQVYTNSTHIQQVINQIFSKSLIKKIHENSHIHIDIDNYSFKISSFVILAYNGFIKTNYAINIVNNISKARISLEKMSSYYNLTKRELEIVDLIIEGYTNKEISDKLYISFNTVRTHVFNIFKKMDVKSRSAIVHKISQII